ncbi:DUF72 domain-containing protein [uncultured Alsobacter sp.]|uniref:DUF72 domain-containing protein n=1 Tax=uncultured Alsobacter sp. TaxID=1748258 RepID=UPI0025E05575|nr:DUF72 domain-containing protein [uncultured Alsobacter sp.]
MGGAVLVGTAGWSVPRIHAAHFPAGGSLLERYAAVFPAVEINTSFYRPHRRSTYERWAASVPTDFRFSVKVPKAVTHSDWQAIEAPLDGFFEEIGGLGPKLGAVLLQLPPKQAFSPADADRLLRAVRSRTQAPVVLEPRHASWFGPAGEDLLRSLRIARVAADPPRAAGADQPAGWPGFAYLRLHGSPEIYRSSYADGRLERLATQVLGAARTGAQAWCIFDNTQSYAATGDALGLKALIDPAERTHP